jgi:hypothetical protein
MSHADILFQYYTTTANTDTSEAELAYQADQHGVTMVYSIFAAASAGTTATWRLHHCSDSEEPGPANILYYARTTATSNLPNAAQNVKIILNPGDRIFCQLHSGDAVTVSGYGLRPSQMSGSEMQISDETDQALELPAPLRAGQQVAPMRKSGSGSAESGY